MQRQAAAFPRDSAGSAAFEEILALDAGDRGARPFENGFGPWTVRGGCKPPLRRTVLSKARLPPWAVSRIAASFSGPIGSATRRKPAGSVAPGAKRFVTSRLPNPQRRAHRSHRTLVGSLVASSAKDGLSRRKLQRFSVWPPPARGRSGSDDRC